MKLPFTSVNDCRLSKLQEYANFFQTWKESKLPGLTSETFFATINMCLTLRGIIIYLLEECCFPYVATGHLQSDPIESRFGRYRQMSGANYYISVKQLIESEQKIKVVSLLKHSVIYFIRFFKFKIAVLKIIILF